ncbi:MAG TPA: TRAP transporter substrate-binding protein [Gammaproteobacteria bacterium]
MKLTKLMTGFALAACVSLPAQAEKLVLKFGHVGKPGSLFDLCANEFTKRVNARLGDKAEVQAFGSSQLGKDNELLQKLKLNQVTFALPSSVMSSVADEFGVFEMPYIIKDREHMNRVENTLFDSVMQPAAKAKGYRILALWENGFRHITNNLRPINKPEDLQGIKLRTPKGAWRVKMFKGYGANPSPMAFSEVFTALQTGVIDGQENPYAQIASAKFQEVQKYLSITGHVYTPAYVLVSDTHFAKLPADVQEIVVSTAREMQAYVYALAAKLETDLLAELVAGGISVNTADKNAFIAASQPIYDEFASSVAGGDKLIKTVLDLGK